MPRKLSFTASRRRGVRLFRWSALALVGVTAGALLGEKVVGTKWGGRGDEPASYSHLSANPDAAVPPTGGAASCLDCRDSYGVAARLRADREGRMSDEFRELGAVDVDAPTASEPDDGYRYGGRFPDPQVGEQSSPTAEARTTVTAPAEDGASPALSAALPPDD